MCSSRCCVAFLSDFFVRQCARLNSITHRYRFLVFVRASYTLTAAHSFSVPMQRRARLFFGSFSDLNQYTKSLHDARSSKKNEHASSLSCVVPSPSPGRIAFNTCARVYSSLHLRKCTCFSSTYIKLAHRCMLVPITRITHTHTIALAPVLSLQRMLRSHTRASMYHHLARETPHN